MRTVLRQVVLNRRATLYNGIIATRGVVPNAVSGSLKYFNSRSGHYARDTITFLQVHIANWHVRGSTPWDEVGPGSSSSWTASVEYPVGVFTQILFAGSATGTATTLTTLVSDFVAVNIPKDAKFWIRMFGNNNAGGLHYQDGTGGKNSDATNMGDQFEASGTSISDKTMGGTIAGAGATLGIRPLAIVGPMRRPSVLYVGDSIAAGATDDMTVGAVGDAGVIGRWIGPNFGYVASGISGEQITTFIAGSNSALRRALIPYCSHFITEMGNNDIWGGTFTDAQILTKWQTLWAFASSQGKKVYQTTITPRTTSTDAWATTGNQTKVIGTGDAVRLTVNTNLRASAYSGIDGYFEIAYPIESVNNSGIWNAPNYTSDGTHPLSTGNVAIQALNQSLALIAIRR